jgi:outer membrane protein OmpA-like peptidoglycan-associated protein
VVRSALQAVAGDRLVIMDSGVGSDDPAVRSDRETDKQQNRRVTVRVTPVAAASTSGDVRP